MHPSTEDGGPRILIVDDLKSNVRLLEHTLRRAGFVEVLSTTDPCEVVDLHLEHRFDLMLLDLQMPQMNGFEVLRLLERVRSSHPVTVLVISADSADIPAVLDSGGDGFLAKPFRLNEVVDRVQEMLKAAGVASLVVAARLSADAQSAALEAADTPQP